MFKKYVLFYCYTSDSSSRSCIGTNRTWYLTGSVGHCLSALKKKKGSSLKRQSVTPTKSNGRIRGIPAYKVTYVRAEV